MKARSSRSENDYGAFADRMTAETPLIDFVTDLLEVARAIEQAARTLTDEHGAETQYREETLRGVEIATEHAYLAEARIERGEDLYQAALDVMTGQQGLALACINFLNIKIEEAKRNHRREQAMHAAHRSHEKHRAMKQRAFAYMANRWATVPNQSLEKWAEDLIQVAAAVSHRTRRDWAAEFKKQRSASKP